MPHAPSAGRACVTCDAACVPFLVRSVLGMPWEQIGTQGLLAHSARLFFAKAPQACRGGVLESCAGLPFSAGITRAAGQAAQQITCVLGFREVCHRLACATHSTCSPFCVSDTCDASSVVHCKGSEIRKVFVASNADLAVFASAMEASLLSFLRSSELCHRSSFLACGAREACIGCHTCCAAEHGVCVCVPMHVCHWSRFEADAARCIQEGPLPAAGPANVAVISEEICMMSSAATSACTLLRSTGVCAELGAHQAAPPMSGCDTDLVQPRRVVLLHAVAWRH